MQSLSQIKYNRSPKGIQRNIKYKKSKKYKLFRKKYNAFHHDLNTFKQYHNFVIENCAICNTNKNIEMHHPNPKMPLHIYFLCKIHHGEQHGKIVKSLIFIYDRRKSYKGEMT